MKCEMVLKGILRKSHPHQNIFSVLTTKIQKEKKESENKNLSHEHSSEKCRFYQNNCQ